MSTNTQLNDIKTLLTSIDSRLSNEGGSGEADSEISAGQPIFVKSSGHIDLARADALPQAGYAGLAQADVAATFAASYSTGLLSLPDWTAVAGTQYLSPGAIYYLSTTDAGHITTVAPATGYLVVVGRALSVSQMHAYQEPIIAL